MTDKALTDTPEQMQAREIFDLWMSTRPAGVYQSSIMATEAARLIDLIADAISGITTWRDVYDEMLKADIKDRDQIIRQFAENSWNAWVHYRDVDEARWSELTKRQQNTWILAMRSALKNTKTKTET